jgi:hypothetical protein
MDDGRDAYLSRYLKNWAVQQQPAADSRERLLRMAAGSPLPCKPTAFSAFKTFIKPKNLDRPPLDRFAIPMTQSNIWSFHIALELRLVT